MKIIQNMLNNVVVYALTSGDAFFESEGFNQIVVWVVGLSTGLAVISASICLIRIMVASDTQAIAEAKADLKQIAIAWVALNSLTAIIDLLLSLVEFA